MKDPVEIRFRRANDFGGTIPGFATAFPNFHEGRHHGNLIYGLVQLKAAAVLVKPDLPANLLTGDMPNMFRLAFDWARNNGYEAGFPNFHINSTIQPPVRGIVLFKPGFATYKPDLPASVLHGDVPNKFRLAHDWASSNGYVSGIPNFHVNSTVQPPVTGVTLLKDNAAFFNPAGPAYDLCAEWCIRFEKETADPRHKEIRDARTYIGDTKDEAIAQAWNYYKTLYGPVVREKVDVRLNNAGPCQ